MSAKVSQETENGTAVDKMIALLEANDRYRVIRKVTLEDLPVGVPEGAYRVGVILDTETTGKDSAVDKIIELSMIRFAYHPETGEVLSVLDTLDQVEDPGAPLTEKIIQFTGITDEMVAGQHIHDAEVAKLLDGASVVIAHGAGFDRKLVERRFPGLFEEIGWVCTHLDVDWEAEGVGSAKLDYLAFRMGFFHDAHRAMNDCVAVFEILGVVLPQAQKTVLQAALDHGRIPTVHLWATNAPFEAKDLLKDRGYRWNDGSDGGYKAWNIQVPENALEDEYAWLKAEVFKRDLKLPEDRITAKLRYSNRKASDRPATRPAP